MPEMPEVETIRRSLEASVAGRTIRSVEVRSPHCLGMASDFAPDVFVRALEGRAFTGFDRRGKYLIARLSGPAVLVIHLRMTGRFVYTPARTPPAGLDPRHAHVTFHLADGGRLTFYDPRKFGRLYLDRLPPGLRALGPEPLDPAFTAEVLGGILKGRKARVKALLLDQSAVAGLGNIYADEALHRAGIHPARRADRLTREEVGQLWEAIRTVLAEGVRHRGTTFSDYRDGRGEPGGFAPLLRVYGREGEPCRHCGTIIGRIKVAGRSSHFCPDCQPRSGRARSTGPSAGREMARRRGDNAGSGL